MPDSFLKAKRKAVEALYTSHLSSDSSDDARQKPRKRQKPLRFQLSDCSGEESESIVTATKKFPIPSLPINELIGNSSKNVSNSLDLAASEERGILPNNMAQTALYSRDLAAIQEHALLSNMPQIGSYSRGLAASREQRILQSNMPQTASYSQGQASSQEQNNNMAETALYFQGLEAASKKQQISQKNEMPQNALYLRMFQYMEKMNKRISELTTKIDRLSFIVEKNSINVNPGFVPYLPEDVNLPVTSVEELEQLNEKIKNENEFSTHLVRFLHNAGSGKSPRAFILSLTKRVLTQEVAVLFSRLGRKGKRSFQNYIETLNVILAAASLKFKDVDREELADMFGKSLAGASEWNKRKFRPSDCSLIFTGDA